jgi:hypothetical protein
MATNTGSTDQTNTGSTDQTNTGSTDQDIGRPGPWREGRYERQGDPIDESVRTPPGTSPSHDTPESTVVTRRDYLFPDQEPDPSEDTTEPPGGDAG